MKKLCSTLFLLCMFAGIAYVLGNATKNRTSQEGCIQLSDFYSLKENTVDVLFTGSSHVYYSVNTCLLYDGYGIASYLLASPGQPVWISYYFLEEAFKTQSPGLVVFDVCTLYNKESDVGAASWPSLISMKPSLAKLKAIRAVNQEEELLDAVGAFFSFPYYHTRYAQLTRQDYENTKHVRYHGYKPDFHVISKQELAKWQPVGTSPFHKTKTGPTSGQAGPTSDRTGPTSGQAAPISERTETYLRKLITLCLDKGIPLVLVNAPYLNQTPQKQEAYDYIRTVAQEYGVPFIDSNFVEEIGIDFEKDLFEASHLNYDGSVKYTDYLAKWLKGHYQIPDRRGDTRYQGWEEASYKFGHLELNGRRLRGMTAFADYWKEVQKLEECVVVVYRKPQGEAAIYEDGKAVFSGAAGEDYLRHFDLGHSDLAVQGKDGQVQVMVDRKDYSFVENGIHVLVYDKVAKGVIDGVGFDAEHGFRAVRKGK